MIRDLYAQLVDWKKEPKRKPLLIRGARQVGKTWLVEHFARSEFENFVEINFEFQPEFKSCFQSPDPKEIITHIELTANISITAPNTLLFLDEIQECPQALKALRYFYEKMPELAVIGAGSLLEFIRQSEELSMPVGRIQNCYMNPLSFGEFLDAGGENKLREFLKSLKPETSIPESVHQKCSRLLKQYLYTGGMPATVDDWLQNRDLKRVDRQHLSLLQNYRDDFGKYGKKADTTLLDKVFRSVPAVAGAKFKYASIDSHRRSRDVKQALELLSRARLVNKVSAVTGAGLPLEAYTDEKSFKVLLLDTGLMQAAAGISGETYLSENLLAVYRGAVAEHYVGQQLLALLPWYREPAIHYWRREARGSEAEVDYLWQSGEFILPIEVKAGKTGTLKSLKLFMQEKKSKIGIRLSLTAPQKGGLSFHDSILSMPLYAVEALPKLAEQAMR